MSLEDTIKERAAAMAEVSDYTVEQAEELIREANERLGIGPKTYVRRRFWEVSIEDQAAAYVEILKNAKEEKARKAARAKRRAAREQRLEDAALKVSCLCALTQDQARDDLTRARTELGVTYDEYIAVRFYEKTWEEQQAASDEIEAYRAERAAAKEEAAMEALQSMADESGLPFEQCEAMAAEANERLGIGPRTYVKHHFWEIPLEEQEEAYAQVLKRAKKRKKIGVDAD